MSVTWEYKRYECSAMGWNLPSNLRTLGAKLMHGQATELWVKAGVDNPGLRTVWPQWSDGRCDVLEEYNVRPLAWFYIYPESMQVQWDTIARALAARISPRICLNAEVEWSGYDAAFVSQWIDGLRSFLKSRGFDIPIGFSSVPSWDKNYGNRGSDYIAFPYGEFCNSCDFSMPQAYFQHPNQILWENPRNTTDKPVVPILWAPGNFPGVSPAAFTDEELVSYAQLVIEQCEHFAGFSSWVIDQPLYQFDAMKGAYELIPAELRDWDVTTDEGKNMQKTHADIEREMAARLTLPMLGGVEGRGMAKVDNIEYPFVEFQKYRAIALRDSIEGFFVNPDNTYSFEEMEKRGDIRWLS